MLIIFASNPVTSPPETVFLELSAAQITGRNLEIEDHAAVRIAFRALRRHAKMFISKAYTWII